MVLSIIGKATRKVANLNAWLKENGAPEYADLYRQAGEKYGVRWDMAIFQSCLETNFWKFGGDVKPAQNNFAGIGAKGGGAPGDSFGTPLKGIEAQLQNLALRAGVSIPEASIISPYVREHYELISARGTTTWESLTGTYATDKEYTNKIFAIAAKYDLRFGQSDEEKIPTWFAIGKDDKGHFAQALAGGEGAVETVTGNSVEDLLELLGKHSKLAKTWQPSTARAADLQSKPDPVDPVKWEKTEWIPFAIKRDKMPRRDIRWPKYLIIHWTAGRPEQTGENGIDYGASKGYTYMYLQGDGKLFQGAPTNAGGYHVGDASVSSFDCLGIEVACAGKLEKVGEAFKPWYATSDKDNIPKDQVIYDEDDPKDDESFKGWYQKYTPAQKKTLIKTALYAIQVLGIKLENIRGHDNIATPFGRKTDPGFSIGEGGMVQFRKDLKALLDKGTTWDKL